MAQDVLVGPDVAAAHRLLGLLDANGLSPKSMLWVLLSDSEVWRLWIVPPDGVDRKVFFDRLASIYARSDRQTFGVDIGALTFASDERFVSGVHRLVGDVRQGAVRVTDTMIGGFFIHEAVVIRIAV